ncbi:hypothetical protein BREVNS_0913 [Brevinematales bacterium NS]|nr:hypothetical protein BREVNS_0913 [Brevinematales bacterium NS]
MKKLFKAAGIPCRFFLFLYWFFCEEETFARMCEGLKKVVKNKK